MSKINDSLPIFKSFIFSILLIIPAYSQDTLKIPDFVEARKSLIEILKAEGISDEKVLMVMRKLPRHLFVPENVKSMAYENHPLEIGHGQTISQPFIIAFMSEALNVQAGEKILEVGTGSGYQAAVLSKLVGRKGKIYTIEIVDDLAKRSAKLLKKLKFNNVHVRSGDGYKGWKKNAPFDKIILTAAPDSIPRNLLEQLKIGGKFLAPIGPVGGGQDLILITRVSATEFKEEKLLDVRFVPMVHES